MSFYSIRFKYIRIDSALSEECNAVKLCCLFRKHINEFLADYLALCLRIIDSRKLVEESVDSIHIDEVSAELFPEHLDDHLRLALAEKSVVYMYTNQIVTNSLYQQCSYYT